MKIITTPQAARLLMVHPKSAARLLDNEGVSYVMVGNARAYALEDVERIAAPRRKAAARAMISKFRKETNETDKIT